MAELDVAAISDEFDVLISTGLEFARGLSSASKERELTQDEVREMRKDMRVRATQVSRNIVALLGQADDVTVRSVLQQAIERSRYGARMDVEARKQQAEHLMATVRLVRQARHDLRM